MNKVNRFLLFIACTLRVFLISVIGIFMLLLFCVFYNTWIAIPSFALFFLFFYLTYSATKEDKYNKRFYSDTVKFISKNDLDFSKYYKTLCKRFKYVWILYIASFNAGKKKPLKVLISYYFLNKKQSRLDKKTHNVNI